MSLEYDKSNPISIEEHAKRLINMSFNDVLPDKFKNYKGKGNLGQFIEKYHFGYDLNSDKEADFKEAGVELKVSCFKQNKNKTYSAKERLVLSIINYMDVIEEQFETSSLIEKNKLLLLIYYLYDNEIKNKLDYIIKFAQLFEFPKEDIKIIKDDWVKIINKIKDGKAHELSEGDTLYLGACTKGAGGNKDLRKQPCCDIKAKQRAFSLKQSYMTHILRNYFIKGKKTYNNDSESIIKNLEVLKNNTFEDYIKNKVEEYKGKEVLKLCEEFDISTRAKNKNANLILKILGVKGKKAKEFEKANIEIKTIKLKNGKPKESMSFRTFKFKEVANSKWEDSDFRNVLSESRFLFVIFNEDDNGVERLETCMFWNMPIEDIENDVKEMWLRTKKIIKEGIQVEVVQRKKDTIRRNNLPKSTENRVAHVRPHGRDSKDTDVLPNGDEFTKQSFWLNKNYIYEQIKNRG
ncbi:MAG: Sau3AI family type II restriction endonuclease [Peptostreptococcaceae bacterium]|nr:Sau3AI family type II restriction endonuclease [Peptostreptococcaceae bacterium]